MTALRRTCCTLAATALTLALAGPASAQDASTDAEPSAILIDDEAMEAMDTMSAALQALTSFSIQSDITTEVVLENGQKIQFSGRTNVQVSRPDAFKVTVEADTQSRDFYYDGRSFTVFAPTLGYYASFDAPPTIAQTLDKAQEEFGIEVPLADLFIWGSDPALRSRVQEALVVRPETVGGRQCMHYAFRQQDVDWQIWIEQADQPLPCKLVITSKTDPAMPEYSAVLNWNVSQPVDKASLAFAPPSDAHRIVLADLAAEAQGDAP